MTVAATSEALSPPDKYRVTPMRWFVLFYFSLLSCNQCLAWFSFSSLSQATTQAYFGTAMDTPTIDLLLNWGPICGICCFPAQSWLMNQRGGLRKAVWAGMLLCL